MRLVDDRRLVYWERFVVLIGNAAKRILGEPLGRLIMKSRTESFDEYPDGMHASACVKRCSHDPIANFAKQGTCQTLPHNSP